MPATPSTYRDEARAARRAAELAAARCDWPARQAALRTLVECTAGTERVSATQAHAESLMWTDVDAACGAWRTAYETAAAAHDERAAARARFHVARCNALGATSVIVTDLPAIESATPNPWHLVLEATDRARAGDAADSIALLDELNALLAADGDAAPDLILEAHALSIRGYVLTDLGRCTESLEALELAIDVMRTAPMYPWSPFVVVNVIAELDDSLRIVDAMAHADALLADATSGRSLVDAAIATTISAWTRMRAGDVAVAVDMIEDSAAALERLAPSDLRELAFGMAVDIRREASVEIVAGDAMTAAEAAAARAEDDPALLAEQAAQLAVLLRCGATPIDAAAVERMLDALPAELSVRARTHVHEARALLDGDAAELERCARTWHRAGAGAAADRCTAAAAITDARLQRATRNTTARAALASLRARGARRDVAIISAGLQRSRFDAPAADGNPAFADLTAIAAAALHSSLRAISFAAGDTIFDHDDAPSALIIIHAGIVELVRPDETGALSTVAVLGAGDVLGESAAIGLPAGVRAVARDAVIASHLPASDLRTLMRRHPEIGAVLLRLACERSVHASSRAHESLQLTVTERLAQTLLDLDARHGRDALPSGRVLDLRITQHELASMVGATRKSVNSAMGALRASELLELRGRTILLPDAAALSEALASGNLRRRSGAGAA